MLQNLIGMLTQQRRRQIVLDRSSRQAHRTGNQPDFIGRRMRQLNGAFARADLWVVKYFIQFVDGSARHAGIFQQYQPFGFGFFSDHLCEDRNQGVAHFNALRIGQKPCIGGQFRTFAGLHEFTVLAIVACGDDDVSV